MELKKYIDFQNVYDGNKTVYAVCPEIRLNKSTSLYQINEKIHFCFMDNVAYEHEKHPYSETYVLIDNLSKQELTRVVINEDDKIEKKNFDFHFFTEIDDAKKYVEKQLDIWTPVMKQMQKELETYTVTRAEIAKAFGIPEGKLRII